MALTKEQQQFLEEVEDFKRNTTEALADSRKLAKKGDNLVRRMNKLERELKKMAKDYTLIRIEKGNK